VPYYKGTVLDHTVPDSSLMCTAMLGVNISIHIILCKSKQKFTEINIIIIGCPNFYTLIFTLNDGGVVCLRVSGTEVLFQILEPKKNLVNYLAKIIHEL